MYISYSGFKSYSSCPRLYWHTYVNETKPPEPDNTVNSLYGSVVGVLMEDFYMEKLWKNQDIQSTLEKRILPIYKKTVSNELRRGRILKWQTPEDKRPNYVSEEELLADVRDTVARAIRIIRFYRLVGPLMEAESKLDSDVKGHRLGGRADFIIHRTSPHHDKVILDGKGSKHRGLYVDPRQLRWYAMLHRMKRGTLPDKLGFVYWRFDPPESIDWVEFSEVDIDDLYEEVLGAISEIERGVTRKSGEPVERTRRAFPTRADDKNCRFCSFLTMCPEGSEMMSKKKTPKVYR